MIAVFIFYSKASGIQAKLACSEEFKHCNIITFDGKDWIMLDFDKAGFLTRKIYCQNGDQLIRSLHIIKDISAIISVNVEHKHKVGWKPYLVRSCNEICRYASGVNIGLTLNPVHLYTKLLKFRRRRNYEVLSAWRRKHGISKQRQFGGTANRLDESTD